MEARGKKASALRWNQATTETAARSPLHAALADSSANPPDKKCFRTILNFNHPKSGCPIA